MDWRGKNVAIVGDVMLDHYVEGIAERRSPEAPVLILDVKKERYVPGGAGNVAANVALMGGKVSLYGVVGKDHYAQRLFEALRTYGISEDGLFADTSRPTTLKTRLVGNGQQLLRTDRELTHPISHEIEEQITDALRNSVPDIVICSDYAKGVITQHLADYTLGWAGLHQIPAVVGPKPANPVSYTGAHLVALNRKEAGQLTGTSLDTEEKIQRSGRSLVDKLHSNVLITLGEDGMTLFPREGNSMHVAAHTHEVADVSGAGDTVLAVMALATSAEYSLRDAMELANRAAGIKVTKYGTHPISYKELCG